MNLIHKKKIYLESLKIRKFEQNLLRLFNKGLIRGTTHTCIGSELSSSYIINYLDKNDVVVSGHRGHGHYLAKTGDYESLLLEIMGLAGGTTDGWGGSQHLYKKNQFYSNGILGGTTAIATGIALSKKQFKMKDKTICFLGDGAFGEGLVYESLNFASINNLKLIYVLEDNKISQSTNTKEVLNINHNFLAKSFNIEYLKLDYPTYDDLEPIKEVLNYVDNKHKPFLLHLELPRLSAHSKGDDTRTKEDLEELFKKDALEIFKIENPKEYAELEKISQKFIDELSILVENAKLPNLDQKKYNSYYSFNANIQDTDLYNGYIKSFDLLSVQINKALLSLLKNDDETIFLGEDIKDPYGGAFKITKGLSSRFPHNFVSTPISEALFVGAAGSASMIKGKYVVEIMFGDFLTLAFDQILNHITKFQPMYNSNINMNLLIRTPMGARRGYGPTHSQNLEKFFLGINNLIVISPSTFHQVDLLYSNAINYGSPILCIENKVEYHTNFNEIIKNFNTPKLYGEKLSFLADINNLSEIEDEHIVFITYGSLVKECMEAADELLIDDEIHSKILIPSMISPIDIKLIKNHCSNSKKIFILEESSVDFSWSSHLCYLLNKLNVNILGMLDNNVIASSSHLENKIILNKKDIVDFVKKNYEH